MQVFGCLRPVLWGSEFARDARRPNVLSLVLCVYTGTTEVGRVCP
jgi:hypothetical protein